jgi:glycogen debranching enzyme
VYGHMAHYRPGYAHLLWKCRRLGWRSRDIIAATTHHVEDVLVNVAYALSLRAMARLSGDAAWDARADRTVGALLDRCWDDERGLFWDLAGPAQEPVKVSTWSSLAPLALPELPGEIAERLVEEHLLDERRYRAPVGIPSVSMDEPAFHPRFHLWRCWRGPSWVNTAYLLLPGLRRVGHDAEADRIAGALGTAALRHGLREYYDPLTGDGLAARGFGWSALVAELAAPSPAPSTR